MAPGAYAQRHPGVDVVVLRGEGRRAAGGPPVDEQLQPPRAAHRRQVVPAGAQDVVEGGQGTGAQAPHPARGQGAGKELAVEHGHGPHPPQDHSGSGVQGAHVGEGIPPSVGGVVAVDDAHGQAADVELLVEDGHGHDLALVPRAGQLRPAAVLAAAVHGTAGPGAHVQAAAVDRGRVGLGRALRMAPVLPALAAGVAQHRPAVDQGQQVPLENGEGDQPLVGPHVAPVLAALVHEGAAAVEAGAVEAPLELGESRGLVGLARGVARDLHLLGRGVFLPRPPAIDPGAVAVDAPHRAPRPVVAHRPQGGTLRHVAPGAAVEAAVETGDGVDDAGAVRRPSEVVPEVAAAEAPQVAALVGFHLEGAGEQVAARGVQGGHVHGGARAAPVDPRRRLQKRVGAWIGCVGQPPRVDAELQAPQVRLARGGDAAVADAGEGEAAARDRVEAGHEVAHGAAVGVGIQPQVDGEVPRAEGRCVRRRQGQALAAVEAARFGRPPGRRPGVVQRQMEGGVTHGARPGPGSPAAGPAHLWRHTSLGDGRRPRYPRRHA